MARRRPQRQTRERNDNKPEPRLAHKRPLPNTNAARSMKFEERGLILITSPEEVNREPAAILGKWRVIDIDPQD